MQSSSISFAFKNWGAQIGLLLSAVSIWSFLMRTLSVSLTAPFEAALRTFRQLFHPLIDLPLSLIHLSVSPVTKDIALLYLAFGGAVGRTFLAVFETNPVGEEFYVATRAGRALNATVKSFPLRVAAVVACLFAWPIVLLVGLQWPLIVRTPRGTTVLPSLPARTRDAWGRDVQAICDLRTVLSVQVSTVLLAAAGLTFAALISAQS
jgi:hypothetical protein